MTEENKPLETDPEDESSSDDLFQEDQQDNQSDGGDKNVDATKEFLTKVSQISGRTFSSVEEYEKHYKNLSSFVGKKVEPEDKTKETKSTTSKTTSDSESVKTILEAQRKIEFFMETPEAKKHFEEYVKPLALGKGVSYAEAWEQIKPLVQSSEEQEKEKEIGVNSKNRIKPINNSEINNLASSAKTGNPASQEALVAKMLGLEK